MNYQEHLVSCCAQQARTLHKLALTLADDIGDASVNRGADPTLAQLADLLSGQVEPLLMALRDQLSSLATGPKL